MDQKNYINEEMKKLQILEGILYIMVDSYQLYFI